MGQYFWRKSCRAIEIPGVMAEGSEWEIVQCILYSKAASWILTFYLCSRATRNPRAIVITPTRELCIQVSKWVSTLPHSKPVTKWPGYDPRSKWDLSSEHSRSCDNTYSWHAGWVQLITTATFSCLPSHRCIQSLSDRVMCVSLYGGSAYGPQVHDLLKLASYLFVSNQRSLYLGEHHQSPH